MVINIEENTGKHEKKEDKHGIGWNNSALLFIQCTLVVGTLLSTMITLRYSLHNVFDNIRPLEVKWHLMLATCYRKSG